MKEGDLYHTLVNKIVSKNNKFARAVVEMVKAIIKIFKHDACVLGNLTLRCVIR